MADKTKQTTERVPPAAPPSSDGARAQPAARTTGRRAELLALAGDLFARDGYTATTVRHIADAAGILSGSLYHHFASKEAIADALLRPFLDETLAACDEIAAGRLPPRARLEALANVSLDALERHQAAIVLLHRDGALLAGLDGLGYLAEAERRLDATWAGVIEAGIDSGDFRASVDPQLAARLVRATLSSVACWYRPGGDPTPRQISGQCLAVALDGIAKKRKKKRR